MPAGIETGSTTSSTSHKPRELEDSPPKSQNTSGTGKEPLTAHLTRRPADAGNELISVGCVSTTHWGLCWGPNSLGAELIFLGLDAAIDCRVGAGLQHEGLFPIRRKWLKYAADVITSNQLLLRCGSDPYIVEQDVLDESTYAVRTSLGLYACTMHVYRLDAGAQLASHDPA